MFTAKVEFTIMGAHTSVIRVYKLCDLSIIPTTGKNLATFSLALASAVRESKEEQKASLPQKKVCEEMEERQAQVNKGRN